MDDKFAQVSRSTEMCGEQRHMPILAHAELGDEGSIAALKSVVCQCVDDGKPIVVKPRHGANGAHVYLWPNPRDVDVSEVIASVDVALNTSDKTWGKECWQLGQVPRGVLVQPMYASMLPIENMSSGSGRALGIAAFHKPLELSVHVVLGVVIGAVLCGYPYHLWVTREGSIQVWNPEDMKHWGVPGVTKHMKPLPVGAIGKLQSVLQKDWDTIRSWSERLVQRAGLDELRVDWLLGDEHWGSRVGELTYMGAGSRIPIPPLSTSIALAFARELVQISRDAAAKSTSIPSADF
eukprot:gnl/TRDRNA2_/TRDRNA2_125556_c0_seq1.p1 gnl/TRDRNA2_/TRDRNA2_125556_c0~~gnl/TRDRNA2_/TRDRNA2_125556_c0_seq1.p1  ORF type:complete len:293 (-),score=36.68 gnl/TRDRNA2_/TRDRNA2_125556_c0_seq1:37-915(-)